MDINVDGLVIAPRLLTLVGKIKGAKSVDMGFTGETKAIQLDVKGDCVMRGLLMPMRREDA